ncbi:MAG: TRAP transporter small permease subunit [Deltaproteobacteria bacterium]|nr:TRAP transporter small permease subunit [Deltaproteobacteria bacterium]
MEKLRKLINILDKIIEWSGKICGWLILILTLFVVYEVITRRLMDMPPRWSFDVTLQLYGGYFMLILAYGLLHNAHVNVDFLYARASARTKAILDIIGYLIFFYPFCLIVTWKGGIFAAQSWAVKEYSYIGAGLVLYYVKTTIPITGLLLLIAGTSIFIQRIMVLIKGEGAAI